jgi:hypothetical protein
MDTALQHLVAFARSPNPAFICTNGGRSEKTKRQFVASVYHVLNSAASTQDLAILRSLLGAQASQFEEVYSAHDGFVLYKDVLSDAAGIEALPVARWDEAGEDMRQWFADLAPEDDPDHIRSGVAFATVPRSGNYFVIPLDGPNAGKIFYADHDGWYDAPFADGFGEFIRRVTKDPAVLLSEELGCFTRYSDGKTSIQWIPESFAVG